MKRKLQRFQDVTRESLGLIKLGALPTKSYDKRDIRAGSLESPEKKRVDLYNYWAPFNQGNTQRCTAYAGTMGFIIQMILKLRNLNVSFDPVEQWHNQVYYPGLADEKVGDYVVSAAKSLRKTGLFFGGKQYKISSYEYVPVSQFRARLAAHYPILIGSHVASGKTFVDKDFYWNPATDKTSRGGHAYVIVGYDDFKQAYICQNSWGRWGENHTGRFYVRYKYAPLLFRGWVLEL